MARGVGIVAVVTDRNAFAATVAALAVLGLTWWLLFGRPPTTGARSKEGPRSFTVLRCPECGDRFPYNPALEGTACNGCEGGVYATAIETALPEGASGRWGKIGVFVIVSIVVLSALALAVVYRVGVLRTAAEAKRHQTLVLPCPFCGRKVGYPASTAGTVFVCSRCKTAFVLPALDAPPG